MGPYLNGHLAFSAPYQIELSSLWNNQILLDHGAHANPIMRNSRGQLMTPLDAALYRGFRGCAKFIQLHGGVPACKIADGEALQDAMSR